MKYIIYANIRKQDKGKYNNYIRKNNLIPAIIYSKFLPTLPIQIYNKNIFKYKKNFLYINYILILNKIFKVKIKNFQENPLNSKLIHIDFIKS